MGLGPRVAKGISTLTAGGSAYAASSGRRTFWSPCRGIDALRDGFALQRARNTSDRSRSRDGRADIERTSPSTSAGWLAF